MKKKIFKIIGIVLASVFGFAGVVFGVMAIMGKFKTPDVYPDVLVFQQNEIVVIDEYIDEYKKEDLYYFTLTGITNNEEYADVGVNKTTCYIWFADEADKSNLNVGASLITLCDAEGNPLKKITDINDKNYNRYKVDCNSPIYFKINSLLDKDGNQISSIANLDGKVLISARHENEMVTTTTPLTIWIDRTINSVSLQDGENFAKTDGTKNAVGLDNYEQSVKVGANVRKYFEYIVNPEKARDPISVQENGKTFELYIVDPSKTDYVKLTPDKFIEDDSVPNDLSDYVYNVVKYDAENEKFYIETSLTDVDHNFKIAVFPTYKAKQDYEASIESVISAGGVVPNHERIDNMLVTNLSVNVVNSNVTSIELDTHSVGFGLYSKNDYVSLNGSSGLNDVKNNNLGLAMYKGTEPTDLRYDEAKFADYQLEVTSLESLEFINQEDDKDIQSYNNLFNEADGKIELSNIYIDENKVLVNKITASGINYYCRNGVLVKDLSADNAFKILKAGTYLDFFTYADDKYNVMQSSLNEETQVRTYGTFDGDVCIDQRFIVNRKINDKGHSSWNIIATKEIAESEDIRLGVLVINSDGTFSVENFFKTAIVVVEVRNLTYSIDPNAHTLNIYHNQDRTVECDSMDFDAIVYELVGSYDAVVFAVPTTANCGVEVLRKDDNTPYVFTIGKDADKKSYYIVGWMEGENYKNKVKITDTNKNEPTILKLMQFKNGYKQTAEDVVQGLIKDNTENEIAVDSIVNTVFETVTINPKQNLDVAQLNYTYSNWDETNKRVNVYENTDNHTIQISSANANMLYKIFKFYGLDTSSGNNFNDYISSGDARVQITGVTYHEAVVIDGKPTKDAYIEITYNVTNKLISEQGIDIVISGVGSYLDDKQVEQSVVLELGPIYVNQSTPSSIAYVSGENKISLTMSNETDAKESNSTLNVIIGYDSNENKYTQTLSLTNGTTTIEHENITFNTQITGDEGEKGFLDAEGFKVPFAVVNYLSLNTEIFTIIALKTDATDPDKITGYEIIAVSAGTGVLQITIGGVNAYLKVVVASDGNYQFKVNNSEVTPNNTTPAYYKHTYTGSAFKLDDFAKLIYDMDKDKDFEKETNNLLASTTDITITNAVCNYYGNGLIEVDETTDRILFTTAAEEETLKIYKNGSNWTFVRTTNEYVPLTITFDVVTKVGTITIQLEISSNITAVFNQDFWQTNTIYAGTTVLVYEQKNSGEFETNALLHIKSTNTPTIYLGDKEDNVTIKQEDSFTTFGIINLNVYVGNSKITSFAFNVVPNVVAYDNNADEVTANDYELESDTPYDITKVFTLKYFTTGTSIVYGKDTNSYYNANKLAPQNTYGEVGKESVPTNLVVSSNLKQENNANADLITTSGTQFTIGWMSDLNNAKDIELALTYTSGGYSHTFKFKDGVSTNVDDNTIPSYIQTTIQNKYSERDDVDITTLMVLNQLTSPVTVTDATCFKVAINGEEYAVSDNKFIIPLTVFKGSIKPFDAEVMFAFEVSGKGQLTYSREFTISPYKPNYVKATAPYCKSAHSETSYDLLNDIFTINGINVNVQSLSVDGIYSDVNREVPLNIITNGSFGDGYIKGNATAGCDVEFARLSGDSLTVYVGYTITYVGGLSYSFTEVLEILNRQAITLNYPEQDEKFGFKDIAFKFYKNENVDYSADGAYLSGAELNSNNYYVISSNRDTADFDDVYTANYAERILISDKPTVISFKDDNIKNINRVSIIDRTTNDVGDPYVIPIAYETQTGFENFFNGIEINLYKPWEVTLPEATAGTHGYIIFKVLTESGNYVYYYIYVFCEGEANVKADSNLVVNAVSDSLPSNLVGTSDLITETDFNDKFGQAYNSNISFYITDVKELTENGYVDVDETGYNIYKYLPNSTTSATDDFDYALLTSKLRGISKYTTLTISVVYSNGGLRTYGIGTITLIVRPETNEGTPTSTDLVNFGLVNADKTNGEYKATITNNKTIVSCPFGSGYTIVKIEQSDNSVVTTTDNKTLTLIRQEDDYTFTVFYKKGNLILKVTYTYLKTTYMGNTTIRSNLGEFVQPASGNPCFETEFNLSEYLDNSAFNYSGPIALGGISLDLSNLTNTTETEISENVSYKIVDKEIILVFDLSTSEYNAVVNLKMGTGNDDPTSTLTFPIKAGVTVKTENSSGKGMSASEGFRLLTEDFIPTGTTKYYDQAIGSKLMVDETKINNNVYKYTIGGLTVYTCADATIEVKFNEDNYITNGSEVLTGITSADDAILNFVHLAEEKDLTMTLKITDGTNAYTTQTMYITVQKTYENLIAQYVTVGADHENVVSGTEIDNIYEYLFKDDPFTDNPPSVASETITYNLRMALVIGYEEDKSPKFATTVNFGTGVENQGMGFAMENNPNKLSFKFENATLSESLDFGRFYENVDVNTPVTLYISNTAGIIDVGYNFQIVPDDSSTDDGKKLTDTITYSKDFGYVGENYISFTEWLKTNEDGTTSSEVKELTIGTLNDGLNDKSFYLTSDDLRNGTDTGSTDSYDEESVTLSYADDGLTKIYIISSDSTDNPTYQLQLIYYGETGLLTCKLTKGDLNDGDQIKFTISLFGTTNYIVENFNIVFTKQSVTAIVGDTVDANTLINLFDDKKLLLNGENKSSAEVANITLKLNTTLPVTDDKHYSYYTINGKETKVESETTNLFTYNTTAKRLTLDQVGETAIVHLVFDVEYNNIYISQVVYSFNVVRNVVIVANGDTVKDRTTLETEFHLTNTNNFPSAYNIASSFNSGDKNTDNQYKTLIINLYERSTGEAKGMENITLMLDSDHHNAVKISDNGSTKTITFYKDLTDTIEILVTVDSSLLNGNGSYSVKWYIEVNGIIDFDGLEDNSTARLKNAGTTAFNSSDSVKIVNSSKSDETAIQMNRNTTFVREENQPNVDVVIQGKFIESNTTNDTLSNKQIFDLDAAISLSDQSGTISNNKSTMSINLPYVESGKTYIVVYKVTFTYLSLGTAEGTQKEIFYVAYMVQNNVAITENIFKTGTGSPETTYHGGQVDMDNRLSADGSLNLFYYAETWTDGTDNYVLTYNGSNNYSVTNSGYYNTADGKVYTEENGTACTKESSTTFYNSENKIYSVFNSSFNNIIAYKDFITKALNGYVSITDSKNNKVYYFKIANLGSGRYGINLKEYWEKAEEISDDTKKKSDAFVKNELVGDLVVYVDGAPVVTLAEYNEQAQKGFMLHTDNKLKYAADIDVNDTTDDDHYIKNMFMDSEISNIADGYNLNKIKDIRVLGIVNKDATIATNGWVTYPDGTDTDTDPDNATSGSLGSAIATISVENGSGLTTYTLHPVIYSGTAGNGKIYKLEETFYVLKTSTSKAEIAVRNYSATSSIINTAFRIAFNPIDGYVSLNTANAFRLYSMNSSNALTYTTEFDTITDNNIPDIAYEEITSPDTKANNTNISIAVSDLIAYKAEDLTRMNYRAEYKVTIGGINVKVYVQFVLPSNVKVINHSGSGNLVVEVKDLNLTQNNTAVDVSKISKVTLDAETTDIYNAETKAITIEREKLTGTYPLQKKLTITLNDDSVITYYLVIKTST